MSDAVQIIPEDTLNNTYGFYANWVPTADQWNAMFGYKVDAIGGSLTNPIVLGIMTLTQPPGGPNDAANKAYVDNVLGDSNSLPDAPTDGTPYCRMNAGWVPAPTTVTATVTGDLVVPGNLSVGLNATILGNLQLGATSNGPFKLDVNGNINVTGTFQLGGTGLGGSIAVTAPTAPLFIGSGVTQSTLLKPPQGGTVLWLASSGLTRLQFDSFASSCSVSQRRANGTPSAPAAMALNDQISNNIIWGHDGTDYFQAALDNIYAAEAWTPTNHGTLHTWQGVNIGSTVIAEQMRLINGNLLIGIAGNTGYRLDVAGGAVRFTTGTGVLPATTVVSGAALAINANSTPAPNVALVGYGSTPGFWGLGALGTYGAATTLVLDTPFAAFNGGGFDGTTWSATADAQIGFRAAENWTAAAHGTYIRFSGKVIGANALAEWARLVNGNLLIGGTTNLGYRLDVVGTAGVRFDAGNGAAFPAIPQAAGLTIGAADNAAPYSVLLGFGANSAPQWIGYRAAGTRAAPTASLVGYALGSLSGGGYGATGFSAAPRGSVQITTMEAWTDTAQGCGVAFRTTPNTTIATAETMRLFGSGNLSIGAGVAPTDAGYRLDVRGTARFDTGAGAAFPASMPTSGLVIGAADVAQPTATMATFGAGGAITPTFSFYRAAGTRAAPTAVPSAVPIAQISGYGYGTTGFSTARLMIQFVTTEAWTDTAQGAAIGFRTTPNTTVATAEMMRLAASGNLLIGTTTDNAVDKLQVTGSARISGGLGMFAHVAPTVQPAFSGAKGGNTALASVIAILVAMGVATDTTTA